MELFGAAFPSADIYIYWLAPFGLCISLKPGKWLFVEHNVANETRPANLFGYNEVFFGLGFASFKMLHGVIRLQSNQSVNGSGMGLALPSHKTLVLTFYVFLRCARSFVPDAFVRVRDAHIDNRHQQQRQTAILYNIRFSFHHCACLLCIYAPGIGTDRYWFTTTTDQRRVIRAVYSLFNGFWLISCEHASPALQWTTYLEHRDGLFHVKMLFEMRWTEILVGNR